MDHMEYHTESDRGLDPGPGARDAATREPRLCSLPVTELVEKLLGRLEREDDPYLFRMLLAVLLHYLSSHYILTAVSISTFSQGLHHALGGRDNFFYLLQQGDKYAGTTADPTLLKRNV